MRPPRDGDPLLESSDLPKFRKQANSYSNIILLYPFWKAQSHLREELQAWALPFPELNSTSEDTTSFTDRKQGQAPRVSEQSLSVQLKHPREAISLASTPAAAAKWLQPCPTLCDPKDGSPPGSPCPWDSPGKNTGVGCHFLLQCMKVKVKSLSCVRLLETPWTAAYHAPPSMGFSRQEYWSGVPLPSPIYPWFSFNTLSLVDVDKQADQGNLTKTAVPCRKWWAFIETHGKKAHDLHSRLKSLTQRNCPFTLLPHFWPKTVVHIINWTWLQITSSGPLLRLSFFNAPQ